MYSYEAINFYLLTVYRITSLMSLGNITQYVLYEHLQVWTLKLCHNLRHFIASPNSYYEGYNLDILKGKPTESFFECISMRFTFLNTSGRKLILTSFQIPFNVIAKLLFPIKKTCHSNRFIKRHFHQIDLKCFYECTVIPLEQSANNR